MLNIGSKLKSLEGSKKYVIELENEKTFFSKKSIRNNKRTF